MSKDGTYSNAQRAALVEQLKDHRSSHPLPRGKLRSWEDYANHIGVSPSVLAEFLGGKYAGDVDRVCRLVDQFLGFEAERSKRLDHREFADIGLAKLMRGVVIAGIKGNSCPLIIGPPGCGKSMVARALAASIETSLFVRIKETCGDARGVTRLLFEQLPNRYRENVESATHRKRLEAIEEYIRRHRSTVLIVDECQKLRKSGLELLRDLHDLSDLDARTNVPLCLFGDAGFYRHLVDSRAGKQSVIAPQLSRRIHPIFDVERDGPAGEGGRVYSVADLIRVFKNDRLKLITPDGLRWLADLANVWGYGMLGFAVAVAQRAHVLARNKGERLEVKHLESALRLALGPTTAEIVDSLAGGELLRKATG